MESVFREFYIWCCQFVIVSTAFLMTGNWLIRRRRLAKSKVANTPMKQAELREPGYVTQRP